ncbi:Transmembrane protein [Ophiophagus hannah]|uniref:Transmembrane protein 107 n=1 Tax=Ophiophagus hannah TaxID=8665 RepID=V8NTG5_OPHHA|nr:Transmembrane protein [Ophiophagus hannah]
MSVLPSLFSVRQKNMPAETPTLFEHGPQTQMGSWPSRQAPKPTVPPSPQSRVVGGLLSVLVVLPDRASSLPKPPWLMHPPESHCSSSCLSSGMAACTGGSLRFAALAAHCSASVCLSFFVFERWETVTYWYILGFCSALPAAVEIFLFVSVFGLKKKPL